MQPLLVVVVMLFILFAGAFAALGSQRSQAGANAGPSRWWIAALGSVAFAVSVAVVMVYLWG